jgi:hypothetical protein
MIRQAIFIAWLSSLCVLADEPLTVDAILERCVKASSAPEVHKMKHAFAFKRSSEVIYQNQDGSTRNKVTRVYEVKPKDGELDTKLLTVNGKAPSESEMQKSSNVRETGEKSRKLEVNAELIARYLFTLGPSEVMNGRPVYTVYFRPRPDAPSNAFFDKLINAMFGELYIDQEDFQVLKATAHLSKRISFFGGIAGAIEQLDLSIVQRRIERGVWVPELTLIDFNGRKLFSDLKFRCEERCGEYQKVAAENATTALAGSR